MKADDLFAMLDINPDKFKSEEKTRSSSQPQVKRNPPDQLSSTVFDVTDWDREQGRKLARRPSETDDMMADFFAASFMQHPEITGNCSDARRQQFLEALLESTEYQQMHESTRANLSASQMATRQFADSFYQLKRDDEKKREQAQAAGKPTDEEGDGDMSCMVAAAVAAREAAEEIDETEEMMSALGIGGNGGQDGQMSTEEVGKIFDRVKGNRQIRDIMERAGRYRRVAQAKQRQKTSHGYDDMVGVHLAGELQNLLATERMMLLDPDFELDALRRIVEHQAACYEYRGEENQGKGPIIVCVDESGSMNGDAIAQAKAFALAMAWIARHQNRYCCLIGYSGGTEGTRCVLPPGKWDSTKVLEWLGHFYGGGTTMDVPLKELPTKYWDEINAPHGKTDVILVTDAIVRVPTQMRDEFLQWKDAEKVKVKTILIQKFDRGAGELESISDEVISTSEINPEAVDSCLSI